MSDLIRLKDAIDAVHKEFDEVCAWDESRQTTANEVENILYEVPSAEPEQKWTLVTEALPKNHEDVLVYGIEAINNKYLYAVRCWDVDTWRPLSAPSVSWIAWQPLPKPWEGE
jgi:hypothetical protein